ncbi:HEXXH motif domain-containing protein [Rugosimonospora africana]|nr:HEXXH motif domain-containing protein [Rugosimonospora africana]
MRSLRAAQRSKVILSIGAVVALARDTGHPHRTLTTDAYELLREVERSAPEAVGAVLDYPPVGAWALRTALALHGGDSAGGDPAGAEPQRLTAVAAAAATRAARPARLPLPGWPAGQVVLPSLGVAVLPAGDAPVEFVAGPAGPEIVAATGRVPVGGPGWHPVPRIRAAHRDLALTLFFDRLDLGAGPRTDDPTAARWQAGVESGWRVLVERHRPVADEFVEAITLLAPLPEPASGTVSATARHAFGAIAMSSPTGARSVAVTLAHELQHAKLSALMDLFPLLSPGPAGRHYAPWRPDPRPFSGVLQGVYAHLAIADFWRREMGGEHSAQVEYVRWRDAVRTTAARLLAADRLTELGRRLVTGVLAEVEGWSETVPAAARREAAEVAERHRDRWVRAHGPIGRPDPAPRFPGAGLAARDERAARHPRKVGEVDRFGEVDR